jgi:HAD superfamily hydrolase (TIGR01490 family)
LKLTLFDLDHTLLAGDTDVLWVDFLLRRGVLDRATFAPRNAAMEAGYRAGSVSADDFCAFYVGTLAGRTPAEWDPLRAAFVAEEIAPRLPPAAHALVREHVDAGERVVLTTATNRYLTEPTAVLLGIGELLATEPEVGADGRFTGRIDGAPNMRAGKVERLHAWLDARGLRLSELNSGAYSDSINDLPLLLAVRRPVAVDPDPQLAAEAQARGWPVLRLHAAR